MAKYVPSFRNEIRDMIYAFGGGPNADREITDMIEAIIRRHLKLLLKEIEWNCAVRRKAVTNYDIIYILRHNIIMLRRLYDYQSKLDLIDKYCNATKPIKPRTSDKTLVESLIMDIDDDQKTVLMKPRTHIECIGRVEVMYKVIAVWDFIAVGRQLLADEITKKMSVQEYFEYSQARGSSFSRTRGSRRNFDKLERWLNPSKRNMDKSALEVISFVAFELVAAIVDGVLLLRKERLEDSTSTSNSNFSTLWSEDIELISDDESVTIGTANQLNNPVLDRQWTEQSETQGSWNDVIQPLTEGEINEVVERYFIKRTILSQNYYKQMKLNVPPNENCGPQDFALDFSGNRQMILIP